MADMKVRVGSIQKVKASMAQIQKDVITEARNAIIEEAREIKALSVAYAPVDEGNLEGAHAIETRLAGDKFHVSVGVRPEYNGVNVGRYLERMHDGVYNLGPKSMAKASATGQPVGRKFLERAYLKRQQGMRQRIERILKGAL